MTDELPIDSVDGIAEPWEAPEGSPGQLRPTVSVTPPGQSSGGIEVAFAKAEGKPRDNDVKSMWSKRVAKTPSPLVLVVHYTSRDGEAQATVCGVAGDEPEHFASDIPLTRLEALLAQLLEAPNERQAAQLAARRIDGLGTPFPGVRNNGLLASHIISKLRDRPDWEERVARGRNVTRAREVANHRAALFDRLGFGVEQDGDVLVLRSGESPEAVAVVVDRGEQPELATKRLGGRAPADLAVDATSRWRVHWAFVLASDELRLYPSHLDVGVGSRGQGHTYLAIDVTNPTDDDLGLLALAFTPEGIEDEGLLDDLITQSARFASDLGDRLKERVYERVIPRLAHAIAESAEEDDLDRLYRQAMMVLFRLLFVAYAEDRDLLPYDRNERYRDASLKAVAHYLLETPDTQLEAVHDDLWQSIRRLWRWIDRGNASHWVPPYDGGLFSSDPQTNPEGAALEQVNLHDAEFGPALRDLLVDKKVGGPVDFRSLSVREFGTIYEGLLESSLRRAETDLTIRKRSSIEFYVPAKKKDSVVVPEGSVYLSDDSGARKATGSYFTKPPAVNHLLDTALDPALDEHLERVSELAAERDSSDVEVARALFDFSCADIAMGSGHFLIAAIDRIENRFAKFLADHPLAAVESQLEKLRSQALANLSGYDAVVEVERAGLLRRQIARRCIYGVDLNRIAVELARVAVWIHTFVPGLPLSFLDHRLLQGDSLAGVGTLEEALDAFEPHRGTGESLLTARISQAIHNATEPLRDLVDLDDATAGEISTAAEKHAEALGRADWARQVFDLVASARAGKTSLPAAPDVDSAEGATELEQAERIARDLRLVHFPYRFPRVFTGERPGFDVIIGNPPWEELTVEEEQWWRARFPELAALSPAKTDARIKELMGEFPDMAERFAADKEQTAEIRKALLNGPYPGLGSADPDLYKAFAWRFIHLVKQGGAVGVVLPTSILLNKGNKDWRERVLASCDAHFVQCQNSNEWLFTDVNPGFPITLASLTQTDARRKGRVSVVGTMSNLQQFHEHRLERDVLIDIDALAQNDPQIQIPKFTKPRDPELFNLLITSHPRLAEDGRPDFSAIPLTELHATDARKRLGILKSDGDHPVYNHRNIDRFRFNVEPGAEQAADWEEAVAHLDAQRFRAAERRNATTADMGKAWHRDRDTLPARNPRIAFREVVHSGNPRKVWAALVPARTLLTNVAPYLVFSRGDLPVQAYLLGMLNSGVCDWIGHLRCGLHLSVFIFKTLPIPLFRPDDPRCWRIAELAAGLALPPNASRAEYGDWLELATPVANDEWDEHVYQLDALASLLYGLPEPLLAEVFHEANPTRSPLDEVVRYRHIWSEVAS